MQGEGLCPGYPGASEQVLIVSQSTSADQIKDDGEYEAFKDLGCFNFDLTNKTAANFLKQLYLDITGYY